MEPDSQARKGRAWLILKMLGIVALVGLAFLVGFSLPQGARQFWPALANIGRYLVANILALLKIVLTWPVTIAMIAWLCAHRFRSEIGELIGRIRSFDPTKGGIQFGDSQSEAPDSPMVTSEDAAKELNEELIRKLEAAANERGQTELLTKAYVAQVQQVLATKDKQTKTWFFMFLNQYLVLNAKSWLRFLNAQTAPIPKDNFLSLWTMIPPSEQQAILSALLRFNLVEEEMFGIQITAIGREYIEVFDGKRTL